METQIAAAPPKWRKFLLQNAVGFVIGLGGFYGLSRLYLDGALGELGASQIVAGTTGLAFLVLALVLAFAIIIGIAMPRVGARVLNLEDEEELREQRRLIALSAVAPVAMGAAMCTLALAGPGGILQPQAALWIVLAMWLVATPVSFWLWKVMDELEREMSRECGNLSYYLIFLVGGSWALLAYSGVMTGPAALDWLTMFHALPLVAGVIVAGRRGMLRQR